MNNIGQSMLVAIKYSENKIKSCNCEKKERRFLLTSTLGKAAFIRNFIESDKNLKMFLL